MALYLDSAIAAEAEIVKYWGWVKGITTNPTLLAQANTPPATTLKTLVSLTSGPVYYQLLASDQEKMIAEGRKAFEIIGSQTILKIPATPLGFEVVATLSSEITCSVTGIYSPAQAAVAKEAGAKIAIAYVNRAERLLGDGIALVRDMSSILKGSDVEILAASIKSPAEAAASLQAGANHLTLPLTMLQAIATHEFSHQTVIDFAAGGIGLTV
ncbi:MULTISPECIES: transaldolase family protein [unclassified Anabaena]|uniref:transaldolase family protein n=1 Tax=unclassified Anabaena TaxID=2619674 RepID=UPI0006AC0A9C|nr:MULTISPECIES: transaldolase family protein [unclassified Anabaena]ALB42822.1 transaldolase [Anabaena sp. WA102]MCX5981585.1 transaldolase [Nostocales cyanobacterium LacPavin_0920_SED1_MAG_38_18]OBQ17694.1 MAG: transaldolase [Anabaena sp. AL93]